jgi:dienelactone hydrolase
MKISLPLCLALALCLFACTENTPVTPVIPNIPSGSDKPESDFPIQRQVNVPTGTTIAGFYEALPASYDTGKNTYPLLISITGAGERGDGSPIELPRVLKPYGPAQMIDGGIFPKDFLVDGKYYAFIVLSIQMRTNKRASADDIEEFLTYARDHYRIDKERIYMTGISLGGGSVWDYAVDNVLFARTLAAITPMAGKSIGPTKAQGKIIADANLPVWAFHSEFDPEVPPAYSINFVNWINEFSPGLARLTLIPTDTHICWKWSYDPKYAEQDSVNVYEWMLMHKRNLQQD